MSSGGGGTSGTQNVQQTTTVKMYPEVEYFMKPFLNEAQYLSDLPYQDYSGTRVAPFNESQKQAIQQVTDRAWTPNPLDAQAQSVIAADLGANWLSTGQQFGGQGNEWERVFTDVNPYATSNTGMNIAAEWNPYVSPTYVPNPLYGVDNPYLNQAIGEAQEDVVSQYQSAIAPQLTTARAQSGSFGNSGLDLMQLQQERQLMDELGDISTGMRMQDYAAQQQLGEADIARQQQARQQAAEQYEQYRQGMLGQVEQSAQLYEGGLQREQADIARAAQLEEQRLQRQLGLYESERQRMQQAAEMAPQLTQQDYRDPMMLLSMGQYAQDQTKLQKEEEYQNWLSAQQWPYQGLDVMANALRTAISGGGGSTVASAPSGYYSNPYASGIAGGLMGYDVASNAGFGNPWIGGLLGGAAGAML